MLLIALGSTSFNYVGPAGGICHLKPFLLRVFWSGFSMRHGRIIRTGYSMQIDIRIRSSSVLHAEAGFLNGYFLVTELNSHPGKAAFRGEGFVD